MLRRLIAAVSDLIRFAEPWAYEDDEPNDLLASPGGTGWFEPLDAPA